MILLLLAIVLAMIAPRLDRDDSAQVREEAERLTLLLQTARDEAILQGRLHAIVLDDEGYRFLRLDDGGVLRAISGDDVLKERTFPPGVAARMTASSGPEEREVTRLLLDPSGDLPPFTIRVSGRGAEWSISGQPNGRIESVLPPTHGSS